jgi:hypothetical protein
MQQEIVSQEDIQRRLSQIVLIHGQQQLIHGNPQSWVWRARCGLKSRSGGYDSGGRMSVMKEIRTKSTGCPMSAPQ